MFGMVPVTTSSSTSLAWMISKQQSHLLGGRPTMAKDEGHAAPGDAGGDKKLEGIKNDEPPLSMRDQLGSI